MKKLFVISMILGAIAVTAPISQAKTTNVETSVASSAQPGRRWNQPGRWNRPNRVVYRTRIRYIGGYRYRETIKITYFRNGRVRTQVVSRVRVGRY